MKGMVFRHKVFQLEEEWMINRIDKRHRPVIDHNVTITVTTTSVIIKNGAKILKKKTSNKGGK